MGLLAAVADLVLSPVCLGCDRSVLPGPERPLVCGRCRVRLRPPPAPRCGRCSAPLQLTGRAVEPTCPDCREWDAALEWAESACLLRAPADQLVYRLKYGGWRLLAEPLAELMARSLARSWRWAASHGGAVPLLVPVPTTRARLRSRGYNQAELLALGLSSRTGIRSLDALARAHATGSQIALQPSARRANVAGAFRTLARAGRIRGRSVLLVDDVLTTGATAGECARMLNEAGARAVGLVSFARALDARRSDTD